MGLLNSPLDNKIRDYANKNHRARLASDETIECKWIQPEKDWLEVFGVETCNWVILTDKSLQDFLTPEEYAKAKIQYEVHDSE